MFAGFVIGLSFGACLGWGFTAIAQDKRKE